MMVVDVWLDHRTHIIPINHKTHSIEFCEFCESCKFCELCVFCKFCEFCEFCKFCEFFEFCEFCEFCKFCEFCDFCKFCEFVSFANSVSSQNSQNLPNLQNWQNWQNLQNSQNSQKLQNSQSSYDSHWSQNSQNLVLWVLWVLRFCEFCECLIAGCGAATACCRSIATDVRSRWQWCGVCRPCTGDWGRHHGWGRNTGRELQMTLWRSCCSSPSGQSWALHWACDRGQICPEPRPPILWIMHTVHVRIPWLSKNSSSPMFPEEHY